MLVSLGLEQGDTPTASKSSSKKRTSPGTSGGPATKASAAGAPSKKSCAESAPASSSAGKRPRVAGKRVAVEGTGSSGDSSAKSGGKAPASSTVGAARASSNESSALLKYSDEEVDGFFRLLGGNDGVLLGAEALQRASKDLRLDFTNEQINRMIEHFDQGKGALSLDDFRTIARLLGRV